MNLIARISLLWCLALLIQIELVDFIHVQSLQLSMFGNLPHRSLGGLFWAQQLQPQREDYVYDYLVEHFATTRGERLIEGQTRPVVDMMTLRVAHEYTNDIDLQKLRFVIMDASLRKAQKK